MIVATAKVCSAVLVVHGCGRGAVAVLYAALCRVHERLDAVYDVWQ